MRYPVSLGVLGLVAALRCAVAVAKSWHRVSPVRRIAGVVLLAALLMCLAALGFGLSTFGAVAGAGVVVAGVTLALVERAES
jgi:hypothetical protein